ncbi:MAG: alpha/beta fold hydrolase [Chloroherpetonaceae bacterium]|nr:alpha/beta fold hydrolase [Chloroherpetonaceae bacterium]
MRKYFSRSFTICYAIVLTIFISSCSHQNETVRSIFTLSEEDRKVFRDLIDNDQDSTEFISSFDLSQIAIKSKVPSSSNSVLLFLHGTAAQSRLYLPLRDSLLRRGIGTVLMDLRGHGLSEGEPGDVRDVNDLIRDLRIVMIHLKKKYPEKKIFLGGHSLGAGLTLKYLQNFAERDSLFIKPDGLVLISGGFVPIPVEECNSADSIKDKNSSKLVVTSDTVHSKFATLNFLEALTYFPLGFMGIHLKPIRLVLPDEEIVREAVSKKLLVSEYSFQFFLAAFPVDLEMAYLLSTFPSLLIVGNQDEVISVCGAKETFRRLNTEEKELLIFSNTNHINVIWRAGGEVGDWIEKMQQRIKRD